MVRCWGLWRWGGLHSRPQPSTGIRFEQIPWTLLPISQPTPHRLFCPKPSPPRTASLVASKVEFQHKIDLYDKYDSATVTFQHLDKVCARGRRDRARRCVRIWSSVVVCSCEKGARNAARRAATTPLRPRLGSGALLV